MKYDKTTIIGLGTCVLLFLLWPRILGMLGVLQPPPPTPVEQQAQGTPGAEDDEAAPERPGDTGEPADQAPATSAPPETADPGTQPAPADTAPGLTGPPPGAPRTGADDLRAAWPAPEDITTRLTAADVFTVEVDPDGGGVTHVVLHEYNQDLPEEGEPAEPVILSRWDHPFMALNLRRSGLTFGPARENVSTPAAYEIQRSTDTGITLTERWEVQPGSSYMLSYSARFSNAGDDTLDLQGLAIEAGAAPPSVSSHAIQARGIGGGGATVAFVDAGRPKTYSGKDVARQDAQMMSMLATRPARWVAVHSQYFVMAVIAGNTEDETAFVGTQLDLRPAPDDRTTPVDPSKGWFNARGLIGSRSVDSGQEVTLTFTGVAGPKKNDVLVDVGGKLHTVIGMDRFLFWNPEWMGFLTRHLLRFLVWLNDLFNVEWGYGLAIIVITVLVKVLFWPLTHHSTKSMRKMQELQPQLKELREKYKDDPQKLYRKQSEFLKGHNVSQLGGCLPMVLQLPVFIALFITFRSAIELRHASFLWANDLSMPDNVFGLPIRPLALLMGGTMFLQQQMTPASADPQQKRMMSFMSVFFIFLFYSMPSGLTLYWTVNQVLTILQTLVTKRLEKRGE